MKTQKSIHGKADLRKYFIGAHPIIQTFMERLRVQEIIGSYFQQDERLTLSMEQTLGVLIHNILTSPMPMYEIADWLNAIDEESLGLNEDDKEFIQDDRIGKMLDKFYEGRHKDVFFRLALRAIKEFDLDCGIMHQDTTTVTFSGKYAGWTAREFATYGKNKDHRPDLKQLVLGISATEDGNVPLVHKVYSGNQTDDCLHVENHQRLRKLLGRADFIYTADCKLATDGNLTKIAACGGQYVSVMPRTWKEDEEFREKVRSGKVKWDLLLTRKNNRKPKAKRDRYYLAEGEFTAKGNTLYWIFSTQKAEQDAQTRTRHIECALENLRKIQSKLNRYSLKTKPSIKSAIRKVLKQHSCENLIAYSVHAHRQYRTSHQGRGRPKADKKGKKVWTQYFSMTFGIDQTALNLESATDGVFPLITNVPIEKYGPKAILEIYKHQAFLERGHSKLKSWQDVTPVLLKKAERVVAFLHIHVMALMISSLIERQLRQAMKKNALASLPIYPETRPCPYPTTFDIVRLFRDVERYEVEERGKVTVFPARLDEMQKRVLKLLEVPTSLYQ
jgi:transposase